MIIDFHTHVFPEKIAANVISKLEASGGIMASTNGTLDGLKASMRDSSIDVSVILPASTAPKQFESINRYAAEINGNDGIISFGGIHPDNDNIEGKLDYIKSLGLPGIKIHPDYQGTYINDKKYIRIIRYAIRIGLLVTTHAGFDVSYPDLVRATPERIADMLDRVYDGKDPEEPSIILAHLGSTDETTKVIDMLAGRNVYLDTAVMLDKIPEELLCELIKKHGATRILFATDCPWASQKKFVDIMQKLKISDKEKSEIMYKNGQKLLKKQNIAL